MSDLDRCAVCSSVHLVRRLGEIECRDCGWVGQPVVTAALSSSAGPASGNSGDDTGVPDRLAGARTEASGSDADASGAEADQLARDVELALSRVLGRSSQRPPYAMS
jgi:hypothetical protein